MTVALACSRIVPRSNRLSLNEPTRKPIGHSLLAFSRDCLGAHGCSSARGAVETILWRFDVSQNRKTSLTFGGTQSACRLSDVYRHCGHPRRCAATFARAHSRHPRRIQLPADGGYLCARAPRQSHAPDVDELRNVSCELVSDVFVDV